IGSRLLGWYRTEMVIAAAVAGSAIVVVTVVLLYGQISQQRASHEALRNVEARVSGIVESAMDPILTVDERQRILVFNAAAEHVFRWPRAAVLGEPLDKLLPERFRQGHRARIEHFGRTGSTSRRMGGQNVLMALRADGEEFPIDASISKVSEGDGKFYTVILRDVSARVVAEEALRRSKEELHELASAAHRAREQEKSRIARELHDELGQQLTALQMDVAWCREKTPSNQEAMASRLARMEALLETTVAATRRISADLRPLMLDDLGLQPALEWLVESFTEHTGVRCELAAGDGELDLPDLQATAVFRTVQESLTNIAKHARASRVDVAIEHRDSELAISVRDDGVGFSPQDSRKPNSYGLLGLRERAALLGGEARVTSAPGRGTHVEVRFPIALEMGRS